MIKRIIFGLTQYLYNRRISDHYLRLKQSESWELDELRHYQLLSFRKLLSWTYRESPFYREFYESRKIRPAAITSLEKMKQLPVVTKDMLRVNRERIQIRRGFRKLYFTETSGTTGQSLVFYRDQDWDAGHRAAVLRGYSWYDIAGWEYNGYLWGTELSEIGRIRTLLRDFLLNRFRLFSYDPARIDQFLKKLSRSVYLEGYSSILYQLARYQNENNIKYRYNLKMIKATAEQLPDYQQHEITRAFGRKAISEYGSAEAGIIAFECPCGTKHINMEHVIVEEEDQEILVTNLLSYAFPIIRYRLGDMIILAESHACPCGMKHSALQEIIGRKGDIIIGKNNTYPSLLLYHIFKNLARKELLLDYQVIQKVPAEIEVFIFSGIDNRQEALLLKELVKNFGNDIDCRIRRGKTPVLINGKRVDFISEIEQRST